MMWFVLAIILFVIAAGGILTGIFAKSVAGWITGVISVILGLIFMFFATFWSNGVGEAKVLVNSVDRTVVGTIEEPGSGFKPAWVDFVDFDLFNQELKFAGGDTAPSYAGGTVNGKEITVNVGENGETRANIDLFANYSLNGNAVTDIYQDYRSQERFTEQIITKQVLSVARAVPSQFTATDFRGKSRGQAEVAITEMLNERLSAYGVEFTNVTIQDIRYPEAVENAITAIEQANQEAQKAEADQRTAEAVAAKNLTEAQGRAAVEIEAARAEAEANRLRGESLSPALLELRRIEALQKAAESGNVIIDNGDGNLLVPEKKQ